MSIKIEFLRDGKVISQAEASWKAVDTLEYKNKEKSKKEVEDDFLVRRTEI